MSNNQFQRVYIPRQIADDCAIVYLGRMTSSLSYYYIVCLSFLKLYRIIFTLGFHMLRDALRPFCPNNKTTEY